MTSGHDNLGEDAQQRLVVDAQIFTELVEPYIRANAAILSRNAHLGLRDLTHVFDASPREVDDNGRHTRVCEDAQKWIQKRSCVILELMRQCRPEVLMTRLLLDFVSYKSGVKPLSVPSSSAAKVIISRSHSDRIMDERRSSIMSASLPSKLGSSMMDRNEVRKWLYSPSPDSPGSSRTSYFDSSQSTGRSSHSSSFKSFCRSSLTTIFQLDPVPNEQQRPASTSTTAINEPKLLAAQFYQQAQNPKPIQCDFVMNGRDQVMIWDGVNTCPRGVAPLSSVSPESLR